MTRSKPLRELVREIPCTVQLPNCEGMPTCGAHLNEQEFGKGMSMKADDVAIAAACNACHTEIDNGKALSREERQWYMRRACIRTHVELWRRGKVGVL